MSLRFSQANSLFRALVCQSSQAPQRALSFLHRQRGEPPAGTRAGQAFARFGMVARTVMAADERVVLLVEEARVAEVERQTLMPADVQVAVAAPAKAHRERLARHAVEEQLEPDALAFAQAARLRQHLKRRRLDHEPQRCRIMRAHSVGIWCFRKEPA